MKKILQIASALLLCLSSINSTAQITGTAVVTGPSSTRPPYILPAANNVTITSILTVTDVVGSYTMCGIPDGLGAFDNGNGSFTLLMNHELTATAGVVRAHGATGAFVSKWVINKSNLAVLSGADLIQSVYLNAGTGYTLTPAVTFTRFCSADLPATSAFWNAASGLGTQNRIFMNGEESGTEGRAFAHVVTGVDAGKSYELPRLGKAAWENAVACAYTGTRTVVGLMDDGTGGQVYFYIGTKTNTGLDVDKAGLTNGNLYGVAVASLAAETSTSFPAPNTTFSLINLGDVSAINGASLNSLSTATGVTTFLRPEDGSWDPKNANVFYFNTTNAFNSPSRLWKLTFTNINQPELGGTITAVLDGTEGQQMLDNMGLDNWGHILLQEDVGNNAWNGRILQYDIATDALTPFAQHDPNLFVPPSTATLTQDEETSGILDMQTILGPGWFITADQAHFAIPGQCVEGGQLLALYNPTTAASNPEIATFCNAYNIPNNSVLTSTANGTDYGVVATTTSSTRSFTLQNLGQGPLVISSLTITGANASEFSLVSPPSTPLTITANNTQVLNIKYAPSAAGTHSATININNNDLDESAFNFRVQGTGTVLSTVGLSNHTTESEIASIYPNPVNDMAFVKIMTTKKQLISISLFDIQGKEINSSQEEVSKGEQQFQIQTKNLNNGVYFVKVAIDGNTIVKKLVVSH